MDDERRLPAIYKKGHNSDPAPRNEQQKVTEPAIVLTKNKNKETGAKNRPRFFIPNEQILTSNVLRYAGYCNPYPTYTFSSFYLTLKLPKIPFLNCKKPYPLQETPSG